MSDAFVQRRCVNSVAGAFLSRSWTAADDNTGRSFAEEENCLLPLRLAALLQHDLILA